MVDSKFFELICIAEAGFFANKFFFTVFFDLCKLTTFLLYQVFVCLWKGCKVYNTPSTSQSWLQRHMLTHSGDKPFKVRFIARYLLFYEQSYSFFLI